MKLTIKDKRQLVESGYQEPDFPQIEEAMKKRSTEYTIDDEPITREAVSRSWEERRISAA